MALISAASTIFDAGSMSAGFGGNMVFIKKLTASSSATLSFVDGSGGVVLDNTYKEYLFTFKNIHQATNVATLSFQVSTDGGSSYGVNITSSFFYTSHQESGGSTQLYYWTARDLAQSTSFQMLGEDAGNSNEDNYGGKLTLFNPSSTTFVKHFLSDVQSTNRSNFSTRAFTSGYVNTTSAVDAVQFKMTSGNIDSGDICLYGIA